MRMGKKGGGAKDFATRWEAVHEMYTSDSNSDDSDNSKKVSSDSSDDDTARKGKKDRSSVKKSKSKKSEKPKADVEVAALANMVQSNTLDIEELKESQDRIEKKLDAYMVGTDEKLDAILMELRERRVCKSGSRLGYSCRILRYCHTVILSYLLIYLLGNFRKTTANFIMGVHHYILPKIKQLIWTKLDM